MTDRNQEHGFGKDPKQSCITAQQPADLSDPILQEDLDFVAAKFNEDGLSVPESLSTDSIRALLQKESSQKHSAAGAASTNTDSGSCTDPREAFRPRRRWTRPLIGLAACALLVIGLFPVMQKVLPAGEDAPLSMEAEDNGLYQFRSYDELDRQMHSLLPEDSRGGPFQLFANRRTEDLAEYSGDAEVYEDEMAMAQGDAPAVSADGAARENGASSESGAVSGSQAKSADSKHSSTYTQVEGIDEADIVKTDGKYIYYLSSVSNQINIARAKDGKAEWICAVSGSAAESYINDLYILGDKLIAIGSDECDHSGIESSSTAVTIYDLSSMKKPRQISRYSQTGQLLSSRLIGSRLVLVTNDTVYSYRKNCNLPYISFNDGEMQKLPIGDISCFPQVTSPAFTVVGMLDLTTGKVSDDTVKTRAVLGGSNEIYCSDRNLYVTGMVSEDAASEDLTYGALPSDWHYRTQILKVALTGGKVKFASSAIVDGTVNDQFSMDERDGTFRIATTSVRNGEDINNLFLLDRKMEQVGCLIGFAKNEHIEAVRYVKNKAYVITYQQTDPLFIIDLSDPAEPVMEGNVKISGFSTLLVPAGSDHLLGLGFSTETTEFGEAADGVKLVIFDISDPSNPRVADSMEFPDTSSPVQYDHRALLEDPSGEYYAIPCEHQPQYRDAPDDAVIYDDAEEPEEELDVSPEDPSAIDSGDGVYDPEDGPSCGILVFSAKAGKLQVLQDLSCSEYVNRCISIGDYIYGICSDDSIRGFRCKF